MMQGNSNIKLTKQISQYLLSSNDKYRHATMNMNINGYENGIALCALEGRCKIIYQSKCL
jgi:hypothetical protein